MSTLPSSLNLSDVRASGFPIYSLTRDEKYAELRSLIRFTRSGLIAGNVVGQTMHALPLAWNYFPHAWGIRCGKMRTPLQLFGDDRLLPQALSRRAELGKCQTQSDLRKALRSYSGTQSVSNFRPTAAAVIYDRYLPQSGGVTWDMSSGFGGRLLGAMACGRVTKYIGTDPSTLTMDGLCEMRDELLPMMTQLGYVPPVVELVRIGSEDFSPESESIDLCFTSPPYGGHERYSEEPTQSYIRFPTNDAWLNGYMKMTLDNCHVGLRREGFLVVNIAGVKSYPTLHDDFVALAKVSGFRPVETLQLALSKMLGTGKQTVTHKYEPVFAFQRN